MSQHYGIDVSSNNARPIDWEAIATYCRGLGGGGQPFAIVKVNEGAYYVNPYLAPDVAGARAAEFAVAGYYMSSGSSTPAATVAAWNSYSQGLQPFLDVELPAGLGTPEYISHTTELLLRLPSPVYLNQAEVEEGYPQGEGLWLAQYNANPGVTSHPAICHQYSSSTRIPGANGLFDMNLWTGSEAQFRQHFGLPQPVPEIPTPEEYLMIPPPNCADRSIFGACLRTYWLTFRSDPLTEAISDLAWLAWNLPMEQNGTGGNPDAWCANILNTAGPNLRPQYR
jgi:hypothetical protein